MASSRKRNNLQLIMFQSPISLTTFLLEYYVGNIIQAKKKKFSEILN